MKRHVPIIPFLLLAIACNDLEPEGGPPTISGVTVTESDGLYRLDVNATSEADWVYVDLETPIGVAAPDSPEADNTWDIAFRRFFVKSNGGVSGAGAVRVAIVEAETLAEVTRAPVDGWMQDRTKSSDGPDTPDEVPTSDVDLAFNRKNANNDNGWYDYDPVAHTLAPANLVYVVQTRGGSFVALKFVDYYDAAGTPAVVSVRVRTIDPPKAEPGITVDSSAGTVYLDLDGDIATVADPLTSTDWDLAVRGVVLRTNGGTSGSGAGGAAWAPEGVSFDALETVSTTGFVRDADLPVPGPPGSGTAPQNPVLAEWYDYNSSTHQVTPKGRVLVVRGADGASYAKLSVLSYERDVMRVRVAPVVAETLAVRTQIDASDGETWVYLDLEAAGVIAPDTPETNLDWDIAFSSTNIRTNSGTSGAGDAGALEATSTSIDAVSEAPEDGYSVDEMLPLPGPPGSGEYSGNPVLGTWFDYDPVAHRLSVRDVAFIIRTANGDFVKFEVVEYADGIYVFDTAFAGPNRRSF